MPKRRTKTSLPPNPAHPYHADLQRLAEERQRIAAQPRPARNALTLAVNPTLEILPVVWRGLPALLTEGVRTGKSPDAGEELVLIWQDPSTGEARLATASSADLLALKLVAEGITPEAAAAAGGVPVGEIDLCLTRAAQRGLLLAPPSRLQRDPALFDPAWVAPEEFLAAPVFTLQWHLTQACGLACRHCYDRNPRRAVVFEEGMRILDELRAFCRERSVQGQVSFSGGDPLLHPRFIDLYRAAADRGFLLAVLGNLAPREKIEELVAIRRPVYFQVSLEGLEEHNDAMRGVGHFRNTLDFLDELRELGVRSLVMLTLTRDNLDQVLPLAERLRGVADGFTFNRLAQVGEGADLALPDRDDYRAFLLTYLTEARRNPALLLKDNLFNLLLEEEGGPPFGGCTGFGCGAAFNFLALLSDGEVHACRKFPSPVGHLGRQSLAEVYDGELAWRYREGSAACRSCSLRAVCGGCLAVAHGTGRDVFAERDPLCFRAGS